MLSSANFTYSRYQRPSSFNPSQQGANRRPETPKAETGKAETGKTETKPEGSVIKMGGMFGNAMEFSTPSEEHMQYLVDRLNYRVNPEGRHVHFRMEHHKHSPRILMMSGGQVVNQFMADDVPSLEGRLHDMAGFYMSILT